MGVRHLCQLLLLERLGHFRTQALDEQAPIPFEICTDDVARAWNIDGDTIQESTGTGSEDDHPISQMDGFINVVRDKHHGFSRSLPDVEQKTLHLKARLHVKRCKGFIHQQDISAQAQGPRDGGALLHAAREFMRVFMGELTQADLTQELFGALASLFTSDSL